MLLNFLFLACVKNGGITMAQRAKEAYRAAPQFLL